jgi:hypothetical protein
MKRLCLAVVLSGAFVGACAGTTQNASTPSPTPAPAASGSAALARGNFNFHVFAVEIDASGQGDDVTGTMSVTSPDGGFAVDLECSLKTQDGLILIGGDVHDSTLLEYAPEGSRTALVVKPGSPTRTIFYFQETDPRAASCPAFLQSSPVLASDAELTPITGSLALAP